MKLVPLIIALSGIMSFSSCDTRKPLERRIDRSFSVELSYEIDTPNAPGYAVLIEQDDATHFSKGYGYADVPERVQLSPKQSFYAPKFDYILIKAIALLMLDEYELPLNEPVSNFNLQLDDALTAELDKNVTIGHVLSGTSGVFKDFEAGDDYDLSSDEFDILLAFITQKSNLTFEEVAKKYVFNHLNLKSTFFINKDNVDNLIKTHMRAANKHQIVRDENIIGGPATSLSDLRKVIKFLFSLDEIKTAATTPILLNHDDNPRIEHYYYGGSVDITLFGWIWYPGGLEHYFIFDYVLPHFAYSFSYNPEQDAFFGILGNFNGVNTYGKLMEIQTIGNNYIRQE